MSRQLDIAGRPPAPRHLLLVREAIGREYSAAGWRGLGEAAAVKSVYRGERRISMRRMTAGAETAGRSQGARKHHSGERLGVEAADAPLFEALRAWRREHAAEQRVPPYVIFHDATLSAIARERPAAPTS